MLEKLRNIKKIELIKWSLMGVVILELNNMWSVLVTKINSGKEANFFNFDWWKVEVLEYSFTPKVIAISVVGILWMHFIKFGAMKSIASNFKKAIFDNNSENEKNELMLEEIKKIFQENGYPHINNDFKTQSQDAMNDHLEEYQKQQKTMETVSFVELEPEKMLIELQSKTSKSNSNYCSSSNSNSDIKSVITSEEWIVVTGLETENENFNENKNKPKQINETTPLLQQGLEQTRQQKQCLIM